MTTPTVTTNWVEDSDGEQVVDSAGDWLFEGFVPPEIVNTGHYESLTTRRMLNRHIVVPNQDTFIDENLPDENFDGDFINKASDASSNQKDILVQQTDISAFVGAIASLDHVFLWLHRDTPGTFGAWQINRLTSAWTDSVVTWNTKPTSSFFSSGFFKDRTENEWFVIEITDMFRNWLDGTWDNHGLSLTTRIGTGEVVFDSVESETEIEERPFFDIYFWTFG